jgi:lipid II:glycine glycyltransferase (peptidoglycan interpeptide bridge formation enzyme)
MLQLTNSIDKEKWNEFVRTHPNGNIFQTPEMAEVYKQTKNYEPISLAVVDDSTDELLALVLGVIIKEMNGVFEPFASRSIILGGPLFINCEKELQAFNMLMDAYEAGVGKKALYTEIRMLHDIPEFSSLMPNHGYAFEDHFNALISLNKSKDELWNQIKRDRRRGIKKAQNSGVYIEEIQDKTEIDIAFNLIKETYKNAKIPLADISLFKSIYDILLPKKLATILFAKLKDEYLATQVALLYNSTINAFYTGAERNYLSLHPGDLLIWHLLEFGAGNNYKLFDFGGGGAPNKNENLRFYKSRFGTEFPNYGRYKKIHSPLKMKIAEKGFSVYRKLFL